MLDGGKGGVEGSSTDLYKNPLLDQQVVFLNQRYDASKSELLTLADVIAKVKIVRGWR